MSVALTLFGPTFSNQSGLLRLDLDRISCGECDRCAQQFRPHQKWDSIWCTLIDHEYPTSF